MLPGKQSARFRTGHHHPCADAGHFPGRAPIYYPILKVLCESPERAASGAFQNLPGMTRQTFPTCVLLVQKISWRDAATRF